MSLPRHPRLKPTGLAWLPEVPEDWDIARLKERCDVFPSNVDKKSYEGDSAVRLCNYTDVYYNDSITDDLDLMSATATVGQSAKFGLRAGDILVTKDSETADDIGVSAYVPADLPGVVCGYHLALMRPRPSTYGAFVKRVFDSTYVRASLAVKANGLTRVGLSQFAIDNLELPFPPRPEQHAIAAFLDRETAKIDALVAEQERLIELLTEKRQAVVSHAVTKGLDSSAASKPSGVPWMGNLPAHWDVVQSRRLFRVRNEPARTTDQQLTASQKYGMVFQTDFVQMEGRRVVEVIHGTDSLRHAEPNDFVISLRSFQGGLEWCKFAGSVTFHYVVLKPVKDVHEPFFAHLFKSAAYIQALRSTANLIRDGQDLRYSHFVLVDLPLVPLEDQVRIAAYLDLETARIDALVTEVRRAIILLRERRAALISAAVTGQIDVRELNGSDSLESA